MKILIRYFSNLLSALVGRQSTHRADASGEQIPDLATQIVALRIARDASLQQIIDIEKAIDAMAQEYRRKEASDQTSDSELKLLRSRLNDLESQAKTLNRQVESIERNICICDQSIGLRKEGDSALLVVNPEEIEKQARQRHLNRVMLRDAVEKVQIIEKIEESSSVFEEDLTPECLRLPKWSEDVGSDIAVSINEEKETPEH